MTTSNHIPKIEPAKRTGGPARLDGRPAGSTGGVRSPRRQVRLPEDLDQKLSIYCMSRGITPSAALREAVEQMLSSGAGDSGK